MNWQKEIRLNKYLANAVISSIRKVDELIKKGLMLVNGKVVQKLGQRIDPTKNEIEVNGEKDLKKRTFNLYHFK